MRASLVGLCCFLFFGASLEAVTPRYLGYRGSVPGIAGESIGTMSMRSDGRYLFYASPNSTSFKILDLLDMARTVRFDSIDETATNTGIVSTNEIIFNLSLMSDSRLAAATANGVQYFNVSYPYEVALEASRYTRDTSSAAARDVIDACVGPNQQIYFLERNKTATSTEHLIRIVRETTSQSTIAWSSIFATAPTIPTSKTGFPEPIGLLCGANQVYVLAERTNVAETIQTEYWVGFIGASTSSASPLNIYAHASLLDGVNSLKYDKVDYILSDKKDALLFLFNKKVLPTVPVIDDSRVLVVKESGAFAVDIGSGANALASFKEGSDTTYGFFVNTNLINYPSIVGGDSTVRFLFSKATAFISTLNQAGSLTKFGESGVGLSSAGARSPSLWASSASDHYKFGATEGSGLILVSSAPTLNFVQNPMGQTIPTGTPTLNFTLVSDTDLTYELRVDEEADIRGSLTGLTTTPGTLISTGTLTANVNKTFALSSGDLRLTKNGVQTLMIFGRDANDTQSLVARTGLTFSFDPPPGPVLNFGTGFGDQSAQASFKLPKDGDLKTILLHFSYDANDLATLPASSTELEQFTRDVSTGVKGGAITSPIQISATTWGGSYVIAPIENGRLIYMRPQLVDTSGQYSLTSVDAKSVTPYRTLTLSQALGNADSCALRPTAKASLSFWLLSLLGFLGVFLIRKNWAQHF